MAETSHPFWGERISESDGSPSRSVDPGTKADEPNPLLRPRSSATELRPPPPRALPPSQRDYGPTSPDRATPAKRREAERAASAKPASTEAGPPSQPAEPKPSQARSTAKAGANRTTEIQPPAPPPPPPETFAPPTEPSPARPAGPPALRTGVNNRSKGSAIPFAFAEDGTDPTAPASSSYQIGRFLIILLMVAAAAAGGYALSQAFRSSAEPEPEGSTGSFPVAVVDEAVVALID